MKVAAFSVPEFLFYLCIMTMIMAITTRVVVYDYLRLRAALRSLHQVCMLATAADVWAHDIYQASDQRSDWYIPDEQTLILRVRTTDIGWSLHEHKLVRLSGTYDKNKQQWVKKVVSVMALGITHCRFSSLPDQYNTQRIGAVQCDIESESTCITRSVVLRNGKVV